MTAPITGTLEDSRNGILLSDFSGGIVTDTGGLSLKANQSPDALNVLAYEGNLRFRGGYSQFSPMSAGVDGAFTYYDQNQNVHMLEWSAGNLYEVTTGSPVAIASAVYTPGQTIAHEQLNGILYWATITVPLRQWNGTTEQAVSNSGGTGSVPPPACLFLVDFQGSLVAVNVVVSGVPNPGAFMWSNVNDPTTWIGANTQEVGSNDGGQCVFALLMGVAQVGVTPTKQFMVGKDNRQIFLYVGSLGNLIENAVSSPTGIMQGPTAVYIPTDQGLGAVMFLGEDGQFYLSNGIECTVASKGIKQLTLSLINSALASNPGQIFNAVYNQALQYYMCDFGNSTQLIYKWDTAAWWLFRGWPSGVYSSAPINNGLPGVFVGANYGGRTGVYQLGLQQVNDNGNPISAYWTSPYIHAGKPERLKIFQEVTMFSYNVGVQYAVTATAFPRSDGNIQVTTPLLFNDPAVGAVAPQAGSAAIWGASIWGAAYWSGGAATTAMPYQIGGAKGPLVVPSPISKWGPAGYPTPLRTGGAQFTIAYNGGIPDFRVTSFKIAYVLQNENVGALPFSNYGQADLVVAPVVPPPPPPLGFCVKSGSIVPGQCIVGFTLGNLSPGLTGAQLIGFDSSVNQATLPTPEGSQGPAVDLTHNVAYAINTDSVLGTLDINTGMLVNGTSISGPFAPPASVNYPTYKVYAAATNYAQVMALSHDGTNLYISCALASGSGYAVIQVSTATAVVLNSYTTANPIGSIQISPDGSRIYALSNSTSAAFVSVLNSANLSVINTYSTPINASTLATPFIRSAAISTDGSVIALTLVP